MIALDTTHRDPEVLGPSNRSFGLVFAVLFLLLGVSPLWRGGAMRQWALAIAAALFATAIARPQLLGPANRLWLRFGLLMHRVVNPVILAALFYLAVTPFGLVMRFTRKEMVRRFRPDSRLSTYWMPRDRRAADMKQQF